MRYSPDQISSMINVVYNWSFDTYGIRNPFTSDAEEAIRTQLGWTRFEPTKKLSATFAGESKVQFEVRFLRPHDVFADDSKIVEVFLPGELKPNADQSAALSALIRAVFMGESNYDSQVRLKNSNLEKP